MLAILRAFLPSTATIVFYGAVSLAIGGAFTWWSIRLYNNGYYAAIDDIAAETKEAVDAAQKARKKVTECYDGDGTWNAIDRVCRFGG